MSRKNDILVKICAIGSGNVGKTSLIRRYSEGKFNESYLPTLGVDMTSKRITINDKQIKLLLADTGGQEHFARIRPTYYKGALGSIVVFALNDKKSFEAIPNWVDEFTRLATRAVALVLVGNKKDLEKDRVVSKKEALKMAKKHNIPYFETSAKLGGNEINEAYELLVRKILGKLL